MRKPAFCICKNKDADQLRGKREADQRLCFRYTDHYENMSVQYVAISKSGKNDIFRCNKCDIFFLFLLNL